MRHVRIDPREGPSDEGAPWTEQLHVQDRMSRPAVTVAGGAPLDEALRLMAGHRIHYLPVVDAGARLVGIVNEDDVLGLRRSDRPKSPVVAAVMSTPVVSIDPAALLEDAMHLMADRGVGALPVVEGGQVVGIITQSDVVEALARR